MATALQLLNSLIRTSPQRGSKMGDRIEERVYKSLWHILIAGVGVYEVRNHKTKLSKVLACGLIAFHVDGAIADMLDIPPLSRRILNYIKPDDQPTKKRRD